MPARPLDVVVRHQPSAAIIDLRGEINAAAESSLNDAYAAAEARNPDLILLNFSAVEYINSTGIALIVGLLARARATQRRLVACGLNDHYIEIFRITRIAEFMPVYPDETSALGDS